MPRNAFINGATRIVVLAVCIGCAICAPVSAQTIELTVVNQANNSMQVHQWAKSLDQAGFDRVKIGGSGVATSAAPEVRITDSAILVTGVLDSAGRLRLPGGAFSRGEQAAIAAWIDDLKATASEGPSAGGFGLSSERLLALHKRFADYRMGATKGGNCLEMLNRVCADLGMAVELNAAAASELAAADPIADELEGLAAGTALAAILRPWGLAMVPTDRGGRIELQVRPFGEAAEFWPVGWPARKPPKQLAKKLFQREQVEIRDVTLREATDALSRLTELHFLYDYNDMARKGIDLDTTRVSFPPGTTIYLTVIKRVLSQSKLKRELRVDEAGQPFLWISPVR